MDPITRLSYILLGMYLGTLLQAAIRDIVRDREERKRAEAITTGLTEIVREGRR